MATLEVNFFSKTLYRTVTMNVILPTGSMISGLVKDDGQPFKTLYLLHGLTGNYTDWAIYTRIQQLAEAKRLAVVMPSGENSFYIDSKIGNYGKFIGEELVEVTRRMFPLSDKREDTFIAGLSMGGYGALINGLKYNDCFGYVAGLSSALHYFYEPINNIDKTIVNMDCIFGDLEENANTDKNPMYVFEQLMKKRESNPGLNIPKIYLCCGTEDNLINANRRYRDAFINGGIELCYEESEGAHTWDFWNKYIEHVLDWLPIENIDMIEFNNKVE